MEEEAKQQNGMNIESMDVTLTHRLTPAVGSFDLEFMQINVFIKDADGLLTFHADVNRWKCWSDHLDRIQKTCF